MADIRIIAGGAQQAVGNIAGKPSIKPEAGFDSILKDAISKVDMVNQEAEKAISNMAQGGDITETVIAVQKADMSFQVMLEVRNKLLSAYEEIMRMQV